MNTRNQTGYRFETLRNLGLSALCLGILLAYGLRSGSFAFPKWLFFFVVAFTTCVALLLHILKQKKLSLDEVDAVVLVFGAYCASSLLWSPDPGSGLVGLMNYAIAATTFLGLRRVPHERLNIILPFVFVTASSVILIRIAMDEERYGGFGNESFVAEFLLLALPFVAAWWATRSTWEKWLAPVLAFAVLGYLLGYNEYTFSKIVFVGGPILALAGLLIIWRGWLTRQRLVGLSITFIPIAALVLAYGWQRPGTWVSLQTRFELTYNTFMMWLEQPMFGHGAGSFNYVYPRFMQSYQDAFPNASFNTITEMLDFAGAAHNEPMQLLSDYGLVGLVFLVLFGLVLVKAVGSLRNRSALTYAALSHLVVAATISSITFIFQNPATLFTSICALAVLLNRDNARVKTEAPVRTYFFGCPLAITISALVAIGLFASASVMVRIYISHWHFASATRLLLKDPPAAFDLNRLAYVAFPANPEPRRQLFISFMQWLEAQQLARTETIPYDSQAQEEIYEISASTGPQAPGLMLPRIYHFILTDRHHSESETIEILLSDLKRRAPHLPDIYIVEALLGLRTMDLARAKRAIADAKLWVPIQDPELQVFQNAKIKALEAELARRTGSEPSAP